MHNLASCLQVPFYNVGIVTGGAQFLPANRKLSKDDAMFVDVIHGAGFPIAIPSNVSNCTVMFATVIPS